MTIAAELVGEIDVCVRKLCLTEVFRPSQASSTRLYKCEENTCVLVYIVAMLCFVFFQP